MTRTSSARRKRPRVVRPAELSTEAWEKKVLSPPVRGSWLRLLEAVNEPEPINPAAKFGPQDDEINRYKTAVYDQVLQLLARNRLSHIRSYCKVSGKYPLCAVKDNPFHWALFALSKSRRTVLTMHPSRVRQLGLQLLYAHKHQIAPELLTGFIHQTGATGKAKQAWIAKYPDAREWWFDSYLNRQKVASED